MAGGRGLWPLPRRWRARLIGIGFLGGGSGTGVKNPAGPFLDAPAVLIRQKAAEEAAMDDLTAQERHLIMTLRHLMSFTVIVHRNERWRIVLADQETGRIETGEGEDFGRAWDDLGGKDKSVAIDEDAR